MPLRFGDGEVDGIFETAMVPDVRGRSPRDIATLIMARLRLAQMAGLLENSMRLEQISVSPEGVFAPDGAAGLRAELGEGEFRTFRAGYQVYMSLMRSVREFLALRNKLEPLFVSGDSLAAGQKLKIFADYVMLTSELDSKFQKRMAEAGPVLRAALQVLRDKRPESERLTTLRTAFQAGCASLDGILVAQSEFVKHMGVFVDKTLSIAGDIVQMNGPERVALRKS